MNSQRYASRRGALKSLFYKTVSTLHRELQVEFLFPPHIHGMPWMSFRISMYGCNLIYLASLMLVQI